MRQILLLTLAMTVTGTLSLAQAAPSERWEGYRAADSKEVADLNLPFQRFADNAVLEMITPSLGPNSTYEIVKVDIKAAPETTDTKELSRNLRALQIETCRKQKLADCPVFSYTNNGTAFFNKNRFVTCRHGFHNWLTIASQLNGNISVKQLTPPMILLSKAGKVVYNSANSAKPQMKFSTINDNPGLNFTTDYKKSPTPQHVELAMQSDYIEMTLDEKIVKDYAVTERTGGYNILKKNEETYLLGYAGKTNVFGGEGDAPGQKLMVSNGNALDAIPDYGMLQTTNFSSPGTSGGPVVTASGELAGVLCRGDSGKTPEEAKSYPNPLSPSLMTARWNKFPYPSEQELASLDAPQATATVTQ